MKAYWKTFIIYIPVALLISGLLIGCGGKDKPPVPEVWTDALVHAALKARNPEYTGKAAFRIEDGKVIGMELSGANVTDLSSLAGMGIRGLDLRGSGIDDISGLKGLPLKELYLDDTKVADLEPLRGMKLKKLYLNNTEVSDLSPLEGMGLTMLNLLG
ncbi:MAG TPA: leucine-rich repeat domain-containing protein, partial [Proteobacteria bacterium]|nr:leucine-rich repeat domain-containing protein [Pseudomonadota bacterium]